MKKIIIIFLFLISFRINNNLFAMENPNNINFNRNNSIDLNADLTQYLFNALNLVYLNNEPNNIFSFSNRNAIFFYNQNILNLITHLREQINDIKFFYGLDLNSEIVRGALRNFISQFLHDYPEVKSGARVSIGYSSPAFRCSLPDFIFSLTIPNGYDLRRYYNPAERLEIIKRLFDYAFRILDLDFIRYLLNNYNDSLPINFLNNYATPILLANANGVFQAVPLMSSPRRMALKIEDALRLLAGDSPERINYVLILAENLREETLSEKEKFAIKLVRFQEKVDADEREIRQVIREFIDARGIAL